MYTGVDPPMALPAASVTREVGALLTDAVGPRSATLLVTVKTVVDVIATETADEKS